MAGETPDVTMAADRLDKAITALEGRLHTLKSKADAASQRPHDLFSGTAQNEGQAELDAYGKALEDAGREASAALGHAAHELRSLLNGDA
jgi:hypothetical protein